MIETIYKRFIGIQELSQYLDIKINTIYFWIYQKKIPYVKMGRLVKFDIREIDKWVEAKKVKESDIYS